MPFFILWENLQDLESAAPILKSFGYQEVRIKGSHHVFERVLFIFKIGYFYLSRGASSSIPQGIYFSFTPISICLGLKTYF